ncbi:MAG: hypothetical protein ABWW65_02195 [Thermoprotei archaeon]
MLNELYAKLLDGAKALISHYLAAKLVLIVRSIESIGSRNVLVIDEKEYLMRMGLLRGVSSDFMIANKLLYKLLSEYDRVVLIEPERLPRIRPKTSILVSLTPGSYRFKLPKIYEKVFLKRVSEDLYEIVFDNTMEKYRVFIKGSRIYDASKPPGILGRAYEVLANALIEYGELSIRDAVVVLSSELGIDKKKAREIVYMLASKGFMSIEKNRIIIH